MAKTPSVDPPVDPPQEKVQAVPDDLAPLAGGRRTEPEQQPPTLVANSPLVTQSLVGQVVGDFEVQSELGRGGMGVVYKARQVSLDRSVALKMLLGEHFRNPIALTRFLAEARSAAALDHPNIVRVYAVGDSPNGHYFAMEFIDGRTLEEVTVKDGLRKTVGLAAAVNTLVPVCEAVHYAHTRGIVHRDLKPANVMIDRHKRPVVMDFGIAKVLGQSSGLTQEGVIIGTPAYMPPEQAGEQTGKIGPHSDVYALGAILYTLLTGRHTYEATTTLQTILKVIAPDPPTPVRALRPEVPARLEKLCMKCLNKAPADRPPSALAVAEELRQVRAQLASDSRTSIAMAPNPLPVLTLVSEKTGKQVRLSEPSTLVGRGADCDLVLKAADVSKQHCRILLGPRRARVEDLDSANGIQVNGETVAAAELSDGDLLEIAAHAFRIRLKT